MSLRFLMGLSVVGAGACLVMYHVYNNEVSSRLAKSSFYKEAVGIVKSHAGASLLLGEPIEELYTEYKPSKLFNGNVVEFEIALKGSKQKGMVFVKASEQEDESPKLESIFLQLKGDKTKKLIIKESE